MVAKESYRILKSQIISRNCQGRILNFEPNMTLRQNSEVFILFGAATSMGKIMRVVPNSYVIIMQ